MKNINQFKLFTFLLIAAYLLSACGGALPQSVTSGNDPKTQTNDVVFTGVVEAMNGNQWTVSGQVVTVDAATSLDPNVAVGDIVRVEASVKQDGSVVALKVESSSAGGTVDNSNSGNDNQNVNSNDNQNGNSNDNQNDNTNGNGNNNEDSNGNTNDNTNGNDDTEVTGVVEAITITSITVDGVVYNLADFTEFNGAIAVGDQVKIHVIVNADGTFTIREIEKTDGIGEDDGNNNGNSNDVNVNDDNGNGSNSNDNNNDGGNSNEDNSNEDNGNDNGGNSNG